MTKWNASQIASLNPGVTLPNIPIVTLHRSDSSGDTFLFTTYLSKADPSGWGTKIGYNTTVPWPAAPGALGENGQLGHGDGLQGHAGLHRLRRHQLPDPGAAGRPRLRPLRNAKGQYVVPTPASIAAEAAGFVKKTPANGTISLIYGAANGGYPIINYEYAIVSTHQSSSSTAKNIRSVLEWAINPKYGRQLVVPVPGQLPAPALQGRGAVGEADPEHPVMTTVGGVAGSIPATPQAESVGKPPLPRRAVDFARRNEETRLARRGLGGGAPPAGRTGVRGHRARRQGVAGHPGQRLVLPLRADLDLRAGLRRGRAHRRRGPPRARSSARWAIIWGTIASSLIAIVIAVPLSIGAAFALTERMPTWISRPLGFAIEILAGIPSVVIGLWGILTFGPWLADQRLSRSSPDDMPDVPVLRYFRSPVGIGRGTALRRHRAGADDRAHHHLDDA